MTKLFKPLSIYFFGSLLWVTLATFLANGNAYLYFMLMLFWFLGILVIEIKHNKVLLSHDWQLLQNNKIKNIMLIIIGFVILQIVVSLSGSFFRQFISEKNYFPTYSFAIDTWLGIFMNFFSGVISLIIAFFEEIAYRYELFYKFKNKGNITSIALLIMSSVLFGLSHIYNFNGSVLGTLSYAAAGLILGLFYIISKNIWVPIIIHGLFNSVALIAPIVILIFKITSLF
ncbi:CPBP family intramembrane glutamic endopeptidase [Apilactobacillus kunkeei]|uniref:CPBP family intramembrane glutamic endopeptidase n=1 Tax=Apilactobacillus kunkeei TaxID=148814 RepID=UPI001C8A70D8|nr:type II CAAX endopeptidase family protein [Apilactobacillus kunkeei]MBX8456264.1 CPBP family intramembrane metalloprotease [Apilactobacillus kunkeei]